MCFTLNAESLMVDCPGFEPGTPACKADVLASYTNNPFLSTIQDSNLYHLVRSEIFFSIELMVQFSLDVKEHFLLSGWQGSNLHSLASKASSYPILSHPVIKYNHASPSACLSFLSSHDASFTIVASLYLMSSIYDYHRDNPTLMYRVSVSNRIDIPYERMLLNLNPRHSVVPTRLELVLHGS